MHIKLRKIALVLLLLIGSVGVGHVEAAERATPSEGILALLPKSRTSDHSIEVAGHRLDYQAKAGTVSLLSAKDEVTAEIFYVAYTLRSGADREPDPRRPITFVFNGGPGAASAYLHLGALGPRVIATADDGKFLPSPQRLLDNPDTWLDMTDLVFVDPVGTGYSRMSPGQEARNFWGVKQDAASMAAFIRLFLLQEGRTAVYLAGESYGGFRAALLARTLQEEIGISPSGIVLISPALEFALVRPDEFQPLHWALELPSMAAVRLSSEGLSGPALREKLTEIERYSLGDYLTALTSGLEKGGRLASDRVADITGLPLELVQRNFARIPTTLFAKEFARAKSNVLSPYDGTIETADVAPESLGLDGPDPVLDRSVPVLSAPFVNYVREELNYRTDLTYRLLNREISGQWDFGTSPTRQGYAGVMDDLQQARGLNPDMDVLIVNGTTDLVTPYLTSAYLVDQLATLPGAKPIRTELLEGGHMMYLRPDSRNALKKAAAELYRTSR